MKTSLRRLNPMGAGLTAAMVVLLGVVGVTSLRREGPVGKLLRLPGTPSDRTVVGVDAPEAHAKQADARGEEPSDGDALIRAAIRRLTYGPSVVARLHQRVHHQEDAVLGVGDYRQESFERGGRFNLELRTKSSHLRVVGDGAYVWREAAVGGRHRVTRIDLKQFARLTGIQTSPVRTPLARRLPDPPSVAPLTLGGIPRLLTSLTRIYRFRSAQAAVLWEVPVYEVRGTLDANGLPAVGVQWRPTEAADGASGDHRPSEPPVQIPTTVAVSLGQDDLFPYRIVYAWTSAHHETQESDVPRQVEIQFSEVSFGSEIDGRHFDYVPRNDVRWDDITAEVAAASRPMK